LAFFLPIAGPPFFLFGSVAKMNGDRKTMTEPDGRVHKSGSAAFRPLGIVFLVLGVVMVILGNVAWIAFLTMGATFLIIGMQNRAKKDQPGGTAPD
jgi:hypothetical protein